MHGETVTFTSTSYLHAAAVFLLLTVPVHNLKYVDYMDLYSVAQIKSSLRKHFTHSL